MKIIGYGVCGEGESKRYMRETLDCFKKLCDVVIILGNGAGREEQALIESYGFTYRSDKREWGKHQWRIKQDLLERDIKPIAENGDMLVCLDMDEVLDESLTREWILAAELDAYHVFVVDLWNDREHYKPESCFWNVRLWRWNGDTKFKAKPLHCGLAPEWCYHYHRHAPFILKHYGLMDPENRARKVRRYEKYDPNAEHLDRKYYDMLKSNTCKPFDEKQIHDVIAKEVASYKQTKPKVTMPANKKPERFAHVENPFGMIVDIPERHLKETCARKGFRFIGWADDAQKEMEEMFKDTPIDADAADGGQVVLDRSKGSYQRPMEAEIKEIDRLNRMQPEENDAPLLDEEDLNIMHEEAPGTKGRKTKGPSKAKK